MDSRLSEYLISLGIPEEQHAQTLDGWDVSIAQRNGEDAYMVLIKDCEVHMASMSHRRAITRKNARELLAPVLEEYGWVTTRFPLGAIDHKLCDRLGFLHTWDDDRYSYFALTELPFPKAH